MSVPAALRAWAASAARATRLPPDPAGLFFFAVREGSPPPTRTTWPGAAPGTTVVLIRCSGPRAASTAAAVAILTVEAGVMASWAPDS